MQTRQWMITHELMVKPMAQREWIERRGMTAGAFALKYCLLKVGIHRPILPKVAAY
jgi:hypothetical protein